MLDNRAYNRALIANSIERKTSGFDLQALLDEEYRTERALGELGVLQNSSPSELPGINNLQGPFRNIDNFSFPFAIELMGMPNCFKTTAMDKFLISSWEDGNRGLFHHIPEGTELITDENKELKQQDPFLYSMLVGLGSWIASFQSIAKINEFKMLLQDRGSYDRTIFRRTLSQMGQVNPGITSTQDMWEYGLEHPAIPIGGVVLCLQRPDVSISRGSKMDREKLQLLYTQYLRFYNEMLTEQRLVPSFIALDMENPPDECIKSIQSAIKKIVNRPFNEALHIPDNIDFTLK